MLESDTFLKNSPFQLSHANDSSSNFSLSNTTPELLKFQLQEEHRDKLKDINTLDANNSFLNNEVFQNSFNNHLQSKLDEGDIIIDELPSLISTPTSEFDDTENSEQSLEDVNRKIKPNYMNLKVLIENSAFEISKIDKHSVLSLNKSKDTKLLLEKKKELKAYFVSKFSISQQFISSIMSMDDLDSELLIKVLKSTNKLNEAILNLNEEINDLTSKLNNHNISCLLLGYVEDIRLSNLKANMGSQTGGENNSQILDKFVSYVASISVQRNINLPEPLDNAETIEGKFDWIQKCIDTILEVSPHPNINVNDTQLESTELSMDRSLPNVSAPSTNNNSPYKEMDSSMLNESSFLSYSPNRNNNENNRIINEYKTALNDLKFSHQYLLKEFEYSKEHSMKTIHDYRKKNKKLEKELQKYQKPASSSDIQSKDLEISKLRKEINGLRIDSMGSSLSPRPLGEFSPNMDTSEDLATRSSNATSSGILRKEFKKIIGDMQDQYEVELNEERVNRKRIEKELERLRNK